jgi:hypothetical protein
VESNNRKEKQYYLKNRLLHNPIAPLSSLYDLKDVYIRKSLADYPDYVKDDEEFRKLQ